MRSSSFSTSPMLGLVFASALHACGGSTLMQPTPATPAEAPAPSAAPASAPDGARAQGVSSNFQVGQRVQAEWGGQYYVATILEAMPDGTYVVQWEGYGDGSNSAVSPEQMRPLDAAASTAQTSR